MIFLSAGKMSDEKSLKMISRKADSNDQEANVEVNTKGQTGDIHYEKKSAFQVRRAARDFHRDILNTLI